MIQGMYFIFYKYLHCEWLSIVLAHFARATALLGFWAKRITCKTKMVNISHATAITRISAIHEDPAGKYELIQHAYDNAVDLSIIVPVYNYAELISDNINSILAQRTHYSFELILVDDGSTDGAAEIVRQYANDPRVKIIFQKNQGIAGARNTGLNHAVGKYIMFIDCDDLVDNNLVELLMNKAYSSDYDIVMCAHNLVKLQDGKVFSVLPNVYPKNNNLLGYFGHARILNNAGLPWGKVYKRELFDTIRFYPGYWYEDTIIHTMLFTRCKSFAYIPVTAYQYRWYGNNYSHTQGDNTNPKCIDIYWLLKRILNDYATLEDAMYDECFCTALIKHLSAYYYLNIAGLDEPLIEALFSLACDLYDQYGKVHCKLPYMLRVTEKALKNRDIELWKLASMNQ